MATKKYLDYDGVKYLWSKINGKVELLNKFTMTINVLDNNGGGVNTTVTVTVDGKATDYEYSGTPIKLILESNKTYKISVPDLPGYTTPEIIQGTTTAGGQVTHELIYTEQLFGIKIRDISGKYYSVSSWDGTKQADCIAVITDNLSFCIAPEGVQNSKNLYFTGSGNFMPSESELTVFGGDKNNCYARGTNFDAATLTDEIYTVFSDWCDQTGSGPDIARSYTFNNGKKGFLPTLTHAQILYDNQDEIVLAIQKIGGTQPELNTRSLLCHVAYIQPDGGYGCHWNWYAHIYEDYWGYFLVDTDPEANVSGTCWILGNL